MKIILVVLCVVAFLTDVITVDRSKFKTCEQSSFCRRCRKVEPNNSPYELVRETLNTFSDSITADLLNKNNGHIFVLKVDGVQGDMFRVTIDEKTPLRKRYRVTDALKGPVETDEIKVTETESEIVIICGQNKAVIHAVPFKIDFYRNNILYVSANAMGLFKFEHYRTKPTREGHSDQVSETPQDDIDDPGAWEEDFNSFHDSKPYGPEAVALDFTFPQAQVLFGIPEHADSFALKSTLGSGDPYRLYNLDVAFYDLDNGMSLYGSVPVIYGHGTQGTAGIFWMNAAETWIDIYNRNTSAAHFMSESGIVDTFVLLGETPLNTFKQYTSLTGTVPLPQHAALAYHQCRWNYNDERDVTTVSENFDVHDIPMDTMWLDIEYTDDKKYFTWDQKTFPHPLEMIANLTVKGRHLAIILDPHIKATNGYFIHDNCTERGYYTKNKDDQIFEGTCWPGKSSWPDFFNPEIRKYFADQYLLENFKTTTNDVFIWNDMNEPSVFSGPELTMPKDNVHNTEIGTYEHRVVHNLYGHMHLMSTFDGLYRRGHGKFRPFILTRSHFSGSQRYALIWTGDNQSEWGHLAMSIKMCLTQATAGFSFCGGDVGGFLTNTTAELMERWYQAGAFQPFFRSHSASDTERREPWLFPESTKLIIRDAIRKRYKFLPFWYTLFYEHERYGFPVMRSMLAHYPQDPEGFAIDNQYLLGDKLLVHPVAQGGASKVDVYFPRHSVDDDGDLWYDIDDFTLFDTVGYVTIAVDSNKIPVFQRGGTIVAKKEHVRRASTLMKNDPYTLIVCLDKFKEANGTLYADDEQSYEYRDGKYIYLQLEFKNNVLSCKNIDPNAMFSTSANIDRIVFAGLNKIPKSATLLAASKEIPIDILENERTVILDKIGVSIKTSFEIILNF